MRDVLLPGVMMVAANAAKRGIHIRESDLVWDGDLLWVRLAISSGWSSYILLVESELDDDSYKSSVYPRVMDAIDHVGALDTFGPRIEAVTHD